MITGLTNTGITLLIIFLSKWIFRLDDIKANALGYGFGIISSFVLNKSWTFNHNGTFFHSLFRFAIVTLVAYLVNAYTMLALISLGITDLIAHTCGAIPYVVICYIGYRNFVFKTKKP